MEIPCAKSSVLSGLNELYPCPHKYCKIEEGAVGSKLISSQQSVHKLLENVEFKDNNAPSICHFHFYFILIKPVNILLDQILL